MSPMAATHHSQLNDAIFSPPSPFPASFSVGEGRRGKGLCVRRPIKRGRAEFTPSRWDAPAARETLPCRHNHDRLDEGEIKN